MRESTDRVQLALQGDDPVEKMVANRLVQNPTAFRAWENEHAGLMREVAMPGTRPVQAAVLKKAAVGLIHRKALFEYLRDDGVRGDMRQRIIGHFHPASDYAHSVVAEHGLYLRKACSFFCSSHIGESVVRDPGFFDPMQRYQELYAEYFQSFCIAHCSTNQSEAELQASLMPLLKHQLEECRQAIMHARSGTDWMKREAELRSPTGDTARLPRLPRLR